jgi:predicted phage baseplate assembly protein
MPAPVSPPVGPPLGPVPGPSLWWAPAEDGCDHGPSRPVPPRVRPRLALGPVTQAASVDVTSTDASGQRVVDRAPFDPTGPASAALRWAMQDVIPSVTLTDSTGATWRPRRDLLASHADDAHFVVEVADDQVAALRFGDFTFGKGADEGMTFDVTYRIGNGTAGNVAAGALANIVTDRPEIVGVSNPLPALGGVDPEAVEDVRVRAPVAFRTQQRAVTPEDYARLAEQFPSPDLPEVQRAVAAFRWTGSWRTVFLTVDRMGGLDVDDEFEERLRRYLERYRMAGHDVEIEGPVYVPLDLSLLVCARPDAFRSQVHAALMEWFSDRVLPDGRLGVFHPDNLTFGQTVYASPLIAAALDVPGVASVELTRFERWGRPGPEALAAGRLTVGRREIPRLDNDPSFPDRGRLQIHVEGGA